MGHGLHCFAPVWESKNTIGVDFDHVEITNLHRQILYDLTDLGKLKVEACKEKIQESDENINFVGHCLKVERPEDLYSVIEKVDLILNPFSYFPPRKAMTHPAGIIARARPGYA